MTHAKNSAKKFGGQPGDYQMVHDFIDSSKAVVPDMRHRAIFHSAFGCFIVEKVFGHIIINSDGNEVSTRDIAEEHILEDLGMIPTLQDWLNEMQFKDWMMSPELRNKKEIQEEVKKEEEKPKFVSPGITVRQTDDGPKTLSPDRLVLDDNRPNFNMNDLYPRDGEEVKVGPITPEGVVDKFFKEEKSEQTFKNMSRFNVLDGKRFRPQKGDGLNNTLD